MLPATPKLLPWLAAQKLRWVEDPTNARETLDRNYLRRRVLPRTTRAARAVTRNSPGNADMSSSVRRPMEPVAPKTDTAFMAGSDPDEQEKHARNNTGPAG